MTLIKMRSSWRWLAPIAGAMILTAHSRGTNAKSASSTRLRVLARSEIRAQASRDADALELEGRLVDDAGEPLAARSVVIALLRRDGVNVPVVEPISCGRSRMMPSREPESVTIETDVDGRFCARVRSDSEVDRARLRFAGDMTRAAAETTAPIRDGRATRRDVFLTFDAPPEWLDLDRPQVDVSASMQPSPEQFALLGRPLPPSVLSVLDERDTVVAEGAIGGDGRARLSLATSKLQGPGEGTLRLKLRGADDVQPIESAHRVLRRATVQLRSASAPTWSDSESEIEIFVEATTSRGRVEEGAIESSLDGVSIGASSIDHGRARVLARLPKGSDGRTLHLHFLASTPFLRDGAGLDITVPSVAPRRWRAIALGCLALALCAWVGSGWRRSNARRTFRREERARPAVTGTPDVAVIASATQADGWHGVVLDAHDGTPIHDAVIHVRVPSFAGDGVIASGSSDATGSFLLSGAHVAGARIHVNAKHHSPLDASLPSSGRLQISLITRRRALLDRLVSWARSRGAPFDGSRSEPTPADVRLAAREVGESVEVWTARVESAAFGPSPVDEATEQAIRSLEPRGR
jgi:hypothetical protein